MKKIFITAFSFLLFPLLTRACSYQVITHRLSDDPWYYWKIYLAVVMIVSLIIFLRKNKIILITLILILIAVLGFFIYQYPVTTEETHCATGDGLF